MVILRLPWVIKHWKLDVLRDCKKDGSSFLLAALKKDENKPSVLICLSSCESRAILDSSGGVMLCSPGNNPVLPLQEFCKELRVRIPSSASTAFNGKTYRRPGTKKKEKIPSGLVKENVHLIHS